MSVAHCMDNALRIGRLPMPTWKAEIAKLPTECPHDDCGNPKNCRERNAEYLRMQWRIVNRRTK